MPNTRYNFLDINSYVIKSRAKLSRNIDLYQFQRVNDFERLDRILETDGVMIVVEKARVNGLVRHRSITGHQIGVA
jgi:hypothetical protein